MKLNRYILLVVFIIASNLSIGQTVYKPTYESLKPYEGIYELAGDRTLQIAASPVDTTLYALIGQSRYRLRPYSADVFLNNANVQVQFVRKGKVLIGYREQGEKPGVLHKLVSRKVTFSENMWFPRRVKKGRFAYHYTVPKQKKDGLLTGSIVNSGLDTALVHTLVNRIVDGTYPGVHSILIVKDGKLILEEYFYEYNAEKLHELRSASKSFTSALVGIAIDKGLIKDVSVPMLNYLPEYKINDSRKKTITIENLLTQRSGFACYDYDPGSPGNEVKMYPTSNWIKFMLNLPMGGNPGDKALYCSGNVMLLNQIVKNVTHMSIHDFASQNLFSKLGIRNFKWDFVPDSTHMDDYGQVHLTSRDMVKFGLLFLNGGRWKGKQVVSSDYVKQSLTKHSVVDGLNYGYLWWCEDLTANGVTYRGMAAKGNGGQRIFIWPDQHMVAVVTAGNYNTQSSANRLLADCILSGLRVQ